MRRVSVFTVPHEAQSYPTVGNYQETHSHVIFTISNMGNDDYEALVLLHELVEYLLVKKRGISLADIDKFDIAFEAQRQEGDDREPGWEKDAPYHREHVFAESLERLMAAELGVDWDKYDRKVSSL